MQLTAIDGLPPKTAGGPLSEKSTVNTLLHIIETLQAQGEGLSTEQQKTIEELKGRVKELTDKQEFLQSELLAEKEKNAELKKQHEAKEKARMDRERASLEAKRLANEEKRRRLEAEKARKLEEVQKEYMVAWRCLGAARTALNRLRSNRMNGTIFTTTWSDDVQHASLERFYTGCHYHGWMRYCYKMVTNDNQAESYLLQQIQKYEPLVELLRSQKEALEK